MTSVNNRPEILTKLGVGSGLDTTALIEALVNAETEGVKESLDNKESEYKAQISAFSHSESAVLANSGRNYPIGAAFFYRSAGWKMLPEPVTDCHFSLAHDSAPCCSQTVA